MEDNRLPVALGLLITATLIIIILFVQNIGAIG